MKEQFAGIGIGSIQIFEMMLSKGTFLLSIEQDAELDIIE